MAKICKGLWPPENANRTKQNISMYLADSQKVTGSLERCRTLWTQSVIQMTV